MSKGVFNLLHEKWILASDSQNTLGSFSILEIFERAHELKSLSGELPTQDIAILRLLLSVLHTVFYRYSPNGDHDELESKSQAIARWSEVWCAHKFPFSLIRDYLLAYEDRFYLLHDEYPFMQVKSTEGFQTSEGKAIIASEKDLNYFIGEIAESGNKENLFLSRERKNELSLAETARWLIHLNGFDLSPAGRPPDKGVKINRYKSAWLANLGLVYLQGDTLFETMMLNLKLGSEEEDDYLDEEPIWESQTQIDGSILEEINVSIPRNLSKLYSMPFRFVELVPSDDKKVVSKILIWSGCKFSEEKNQLVEPMTVWRRVNEDRKPKLHSAEKMIWRDFGALVIKNQKDTERPGVLDWIQGLSESVAYDLGVFKVRTVGFESKNNSAVKDIFSDGFSIHSQLIGRVEEGGWLLRICDEISAIEDLVKHVGFLASDLGIAKGGGDKEARHEGRKAKEQAYTCIDVPFRKWLESIDPEIDNIDTKCNSWREEAKAIIRQLGAELVDKSGVQALVGRKLEGKWYTAAEAHIRFLSRVKSI